MMRLSCGRTWRWGVTAVVLIAGVGVVYWLDRTKPEQLATRISRSFRASEVQKRIARSFPASGIKKVILRAGAADSAEVTTVPRAEFVEVSGVPAGGAKGYHSLDPNWRETPADEWGLDFVSAQHGEVLVISTKNEIRYIHHGYTLHSILLRVPVGVEVVRERRELTGEGEPDLRGPRP